MEASDRPKCIKSASISSHIQDGDCQSYTELHLQRGVGRICRPYRCLLPHSYPPKVTKSASISCGRTFFPVQSPTFRYSHGSTRIHSNCQGGKAYASQQGYTHPPVLRRLVTASSNSTDLHGAVKTAGHVCTRTRLGNQLQKIRVNSNPKFRFSGVQIRLDQGRGPTHTGKMANFDNCHRKSQQQSNNNSQDPDVVHRHSGISGENSPNGQITHEALPMVSQNSLEVSPIIGQKIACSETLKKHLIWWKNPQNVLKGCPLHAEEHNLLLFTDALVKGWGAHLGDLTVSGLWSDTEANLHINILELKAEFLAIRSFQTHLLNQRVLVASDNATVVAYLNKQGGGTHSLEMCLMIWRLMAFCNPRAILLRARHIQGCLNVITDSLSRRDKIIQTEWSLHPKIFQGICQIWHSPMVDMFATKMNNKLPLYVSPVPDPNAMAVDALNISWQALDGYAYCPVALIPKLVQKMRTYACRMIVVAPGWPGMSWFGDLIELSTKPPLLLPHCVQLQVPSKSPASESACLASGFKAKSFQNFSKSVAERVKAPQRFSSRRVYESRWTIFESWCKQSQVEFEKPTLSSIADFFTYLFNEKALKPTTIAGYRTAIADHLGPAGIEISHSFELNRLIASFQG